MKLNNPTCQMVVTRLRRLIKPWGGEIKVVYNVLDYLSPTPIPPSLKYRIAGIAPFTRHLGIDLKNRCVLVDTVIPEHEVGGIIHELGHIFATKASLSTAAEIDFLGWEYCVARQLRLYRFWDRSMSGYMLDSDTEWSSLYTAEKREALREAVAVARKKRLVTKTLRPRAIRPPG